MRPRLSITILVLLLASAGAAMAEDKLPPVSAATQECLDCHNIATPGIVAAWRRSAHARVTPEMALRKSVLASRFSALAPPKGLAKLAVGCHECHNGDKTHADSFEHNGRQVHTVVTPADCARCHSEEAQQFKKNIMSKAYGNLVNNPDYHQLEQAINGLPDGKGGFGPADPETKADSCLFCHGTEIKVLGARTVNSDLGDMELPLLSGWPNRGVGRKNPDGSLGSCGACHNGHHFSIATARQPATCAQCHKGPDVPAYKVYQVSKHGAIFASQKKEYDLNKVPWQAGKDFPAPTCASCHVSLLVNSDGVVVAKRTHQMNDRLSWRLFGLPYAHPHPAGPDTSLIVNKAGRHYPTDLDGSFASQYLIGKKDMAARQATMKKVCRSCHSSGWVNGQYARFENTVQTTNSLTLAGTNLMQKAWAKGLADPKDGRYNQPLEKKWVELWLFYANSTRYAAAMMGADYGVFGNGRWYMQKMLAEILEKVEKNPAP